MTGLLAALTLSLSVVSAAKAAAEVRVHRFPGPPYDAVNTWWIEGPDGVVIVDAQRLKHQARYLVEDIRTVTDKPVRAILITHHHPDHTGGLPVLRAAFGPGATILTSAFTRTDIATDGRGLLAARRKTFGRDFPEPAEMPIPDRAVVDGESFTAAGLRFVARVLPDVDSPVSVVWELPDQHVVFLGDVAVDRKTPSLREGDSAHYLATLEKLDGELRSYTAGYPGHGEAGKPADLIAATRSYIVDLRARVAAALARGDPLDDAEIAKIKTALVAAHSAPFDTLLLPHEHETNIEATVRELGGQVRHAPSNPTPAR